MPIIQEVIAELQKRSVEQTAAELDRAFKDKKVEVGVDVKSAEIRAAAERIQREFSDIRAQVKIDIDRDRLRQLEQEASGVGSAIAGIGRAANNASNDLAQFGSAAFGATRGLIALVAIPAVAVLGDLAKVVVTASESLLLLPAAAAAAGAGIGTLKIATSGFGQAIQDIRDQKKFAEDLQAISPAAQQAALSIQALLPEFDNLKNATQDAFFSGLGGTGGLIDRLGTNLIPQIQTLTTSIAGSFNQMMTNVGNQLLTPDNQGLLQNTMNNIAAAFQNAAPAAASFADAFERIMSAGSDFLPGLGSSVADLAEKFDQFIQNAEKTGDLKKWIQDGIDAVAELAKQIGAIGETVYKVFGTDGPNNIRLFGAEIRTLLGDSKAAQGVFTEMANRMIAGIKDIAQGIVNAFTAAFNGVMEVVTLGAWDGKAAPRLPDLRLPNPGIDQPPNNPNPANPPPMGPATGLDPTSLFVPPGGTGTPPPFSGLPGSVPPSPPGTPPGIIPVPAAPAAGAAGNKPSQKDLLDAAMAAVPLADYQVTNPYGTPTGGTPGPTNYSPSTGGPDFGASTGSPTVAPPNEQAIRAWVQQNFGIASTYGTGSWENRVHSYDQGWHHRGLGGATVESGYGFDFSGSQQQMAALANYVAQNAVGQTLELIYQGPGFSQSNLIKNAQFSPNAYDAGTLAQHSSHVHWATTGIPGMGATPGAAGPLAYNNQGRPGTYRQDPDAIFRAENNYESAREDLEQARRKRIAMERSHIGDEIDLEKARREEHDKEVKLEEERRALVKAQQGTFERLSSSTRGMTSSMGQLGAELDADFGISKGLPGLADNLVRFLANIAAAPILGQLGATSMVNEQATGIQGGYGALGIMGAKNLAAGKSPLGLSNPGGSPGMTSYTTSQTPGATAASFSGASGTNWDAVAQGESGGNWAINTGNGFFGGLQFKQSSWEAAGGTQYAARADLATPDQQKTVAEQLLRMQGPGAWPLTYSRGAPSFDEGGVLKPGINVVQNNTGGPEPVAPVGPTKIGGVAPPAGTGTGGIGIEPGGTLDTAIGLAAGGLDAMAPGAGQAAQTGIKLANRAIQFAGQVAGIGMEGLMETFLPTGGSELANNNWLTRIVGGLAGAHPVMPQTAGQQTQAAMQQAGPLRAQDIAANPMNTTHGMAANAPPGPTINLEYNNNGATEDRAGADIAHQMTIALTPPGRGGVVSP